MKTAWGKLRATSVIFLVAVFLIGVAAIASPVARANGCTVTVTAPASIQVAIDTNPAGVICLSGEFHQSVTFDSADSGIKLRGDETAGPYTFSIIQGGKASEGGDRCLRQPAT